MKMRYRHPVLLIFLLMFAAGWAFTLPAIDSHGYWPLTHTSLEIQSISRIIATNATENHRIPSNVEVLKMLTKGGSENYSVASRLDPWRHPYVYKILNANELGFVVYSAGPDGIDNGGDGDDVVAGAKNYKCELYGSCLDAKDYANRVFSISAALVLLTWIGFFIHSTFKWMKRSRRVPEADFGNHHS